VGRTLAVLVLEFRGYQSTYRYTLPDPADHPVLAGNDSLYRILLKGTAANPDDRFQSADEMAGQLLGLLREVVAAESGTPAPAASTLFAADGHPSGETHDGELLRPPWAVLPTLRTSVDDPAYASLATLPDADPAAAAALLTALTPRTVEVELRLARAQMEAVDPGANATLDRIERDDPWEWRVDWYRAQLALADGDADRAYQAFDRVYSDVPGELAPKLALALAAESGGDLTTAAHLYGVVARTDPAYTGAAFGLARCRLAMGDRTGAVAAYRLVPATSGSHVRAEVQAVRALIEPGGTPAPGAVELVEAGRAVDRLQLGPEQRSALARDVLTAALRSLRSGEVVPDEAAVVAGRPLRERDLRLGLEEAYRSLARFADTEADRIDLVDRANRVRPRSLT